MRRKLTIGVGAAGAVLLAAAGGLWAASAQASETTSHTRQVKITDRPVHVEFIDLGAPGRSPGDMHTFTNDTYQDGKKVGTNSGYCVNERVTASAVYVQCHNVISLPEGQLTVQFSRVDPIGRPPSNPFYGAVTGGTGEYRGARGQILVDPATGDVHYATAYLERP